MSRSAYKVFKERDCSPDIVFPKLCGIVVNQAYSTWIWDLDLLLLFTTERITHLELSVLLESSSDLNSDVWGAIAAQCPHLETLSFTGTRRTINPYGTEARYLDAPIRVFPHLKAFSCPYSLLPDPTIQYLTSLSELRSMNIHIKTFWDLIRICCDTTANSGYSPQLDSVETLIFFCDSLKDGGCLAALEFLKPSRLRELSISSYGAILSAAELNSLFASLKNHCERSAFHTMSLVEHSYIDTDYLDAELDAVLPPVFIPASVFNPFLDGYQSLQCIRLDAHILDASDTEVEYIATHLPMLREFALCSALSETDAVKSRMTLRSILSFVIHCRSLQTLSLFIDATITPWLPKEELQKLEHKNLETISLGSSTVLPENIEKAKIFLSILAPKVLDYEWPALDDYPEHQIEE
jgi:hypothetical protein